MKRVIISVLCVSLTFSLFSCINDDSSEGGNVIPTLTIAGSDADEMPVKNIYLGEECVLTPDITYKDGGGESDLKYVWSIGTYTNGSKGSLTEVSTEKELRYNFLEGGAYYAHLTVTDGTVGAVMDYQINVNRTFEEGYILISNDEQNNGNLTFVKTMTAEEIAAGTPQVYIEHSIEKMNEGLTPGKLIGCIHGIVTWPKTVHRLLVSTEDRCLILEPNTFTTLANLPYSEIYDGFKASKFIQCYNPFAYDESGKSVHINMNDMFVFKSNGAVGLKFDDAAVYPYTMWGSVYTQVIVTKYDSHEVCEYNMNTGAFNSTGDLLANENIVTAFGYKTSRAYSPSTYIITQSVDNPDVYNIRSLQINYISYYGTGTKTSFNVTDDTAVPERGTKVVYTPKYNRFYYATGNNIYVCLPTNAAPLPGKSEYAVSFPANEEVTYLHVNTDTEELYVATYDTATKRGNFYIYNTADVRTDNAANVKPTATHKNCADRITEVVYKPSM